MIGSTQARTERESCTTTQRAEDTRVQPTQRLPRFDDVRGRADKITAIGDDYTAIR